MHRRPLETRLLVDVDLWPRVCQYLKETHKEMPREAFGPLAALSPTYTHILVQCMMCVVYCKLTFCKDALRIQRLTYDPLRLSHTPASHWVGWSLRVSRPRGCCPPRPSHHNCNAVWPLLQIIKSCATYTNRPPQPLLLLGWRATTIEQPGVDGAAQWLMYSALLSVCILMNERNILQLKQLLF